MNDVVLNASFRKRFADGPEIAVDNLKVGSGVTVLFGASGAGKTTILRCLAGLERPDLGVISFKGTAWFDGKTKMLLPARKRTVGFVPQDYALFPHLTIEKNVGYGLNELTAAERTKRIAETLSWLGLDGLENRLPRELSGGQQQRVALARAVVRHPQLLLLDEPLAALDTPTRLRLRTELRQRLRQVNIPTILVTHDRLEAMALGDDVVMIHDGRNVQHGPAHEVFSHPVNLAVAEMTAVETIQPGHVLEMRDGLASVAVGEARLTAFAGDLPANTSEVFVCIRAEDVILMRADTVASSPRNRLAVTVLSMTQEGPLLRINLSCGFSLAALLTRPACEELGLKPGDQLFALIKAPQVHLIPFAR